MVTKLGKNIGNGKTKSNVFAIGVHRFYKADSDATNIFSCIALYS